MSKKTILFLSIIILLVLSFGYIIKNRTEKTQSDPKPTQQQINTTTSTQNSNTTTSSIPITPTTNAKPILIIVSHGGLCVDGGCRAEITIRADGFYTDKSDSGAEYSGKLSSRQIQTLIDQIKTTDFTEIKSHAFTVTCPMAYDGQENIYTFVNEKQTIASCTYAINYSSPPFSTISDILKDIYNKRTEKST